MGSPASPNGPAPGRQAPPRPLKFPWAFAARNGLATHPIHHSRVPLPTSHAHNSNASSGPDIPSLFPSTSATPSATNSVNPTVCEIEARLDRLNSASTSPEADVVWEIRNDLKRCLAYTRSRRKSMTLSIEHLRQEGKYHPGVRYIKDLLDLAEVAQVVQDAIDEHLAGVRGEGGNVEEAAKRLEKQWGGHTFFPILRFE